MALLCSQAALHLKIRRAVSVPHAPWANILCCSALQRRIQYVLPAPAARMGLPCLLLVMGSKILCACLAQYAKQMNISSRSVLCMPILFVSSAAYVLKADHICPCRVLLMRIVFVKTAPSARITSMPRVIVRPLKILCVEAAVCAPTESTWIRARCMDLFAHFVQAATRDCTLWPHALLRKMQYAQTAHTVIVGMRFCSSVLQNEILSAKFHRVSSTTRQ